MIVRFRDAVCGSKYRECRSYASADRDNYCMTSFISQEDICQLPNISTSDQIYIPLRLNLPWMYLISGFPLIALEAVQDDGQIIDMLFHILITLPQPPAQSRRIINEGPTISNTGTPLIVAQEENRIERRWEFYDQC